MYPNERHFGLKPIKPGPVCCSASISPSLSGQRDPGQTSDEHKKFSNFELERVRPKSDPGRKITVRFDSGPGAQKNRETGHTGV